MEELKIRKRTLKGKITRLEKSVNDAKERKRIELFSVFRGQLKDMWPEANQLLMDFGYVCKEEEFDEHEIELHAILNRLEELMANVQEQDSQTIGKAVNESHSVNIPKIDLPSFDGNVMNWLTFRDIFKSVIHDNQSIPKIMKLQYLKLSLKEQAATLLSSTQITENNYEIAWKLLNERYNKNKEITFAIMDKLFNQPNISSESASGLRKLINVTCECLDSLEIMELPVEQWDSVIIYFLRKKLDPESLRAWELYQGADKIGTLQKMKVFLDERARMLASLNSQKMKSSPQAKWEARKPLDEGGFSKSRFDQPGGGGGGGFLNNTTMSSPSNPEKKKSDRVSNVVPVTIAQIHAMSDTDDTLKIGSLTCKIVTIVGLVQSVDVQSTKITYTIDDYTGPGIEVQMWIGENDDQNKKINIVQEKTYARVTGAIRSMKGKRHVIAFNVASLKDVNEISMHIAEVIHASMAVADMDKQSGASSNGFNSTSMTTPGMGTTDTFDSSDLRKLSNPQQLVKQAIINCKDEAGISVRDLCNNLKSVNRQAIQEAVEFLSNEGHIYSTIDEEHFKSTDWA